MAGDKAGLSGSMVPQMGLISERRYLDSLDFAQFWTESLTVGRYLPICRKHFHLNAWSNEWGMGLKTMISMFIPLWRD